MPDISRSINIKAPLDKVFKLIADFGKYPEFLPEIESAKIVKKSASAVDVHFVIDLIVKSEYTLRFKLKKPDAITWVMVDGKNMKSNSGSWMLKAKSKSSTDVTYNVSVEFDWFVPSSIAAGLIENNLPKMLKSFKSRAESSK